MRRDATGCSCDEAQFGYVAFFNGSHRVVQHHSAEQHAQQEYLGVIGVVLINGTETLGIKKPHSLIRLSLKLEGLAPDVNAFGTGLGGATSLKPASVVEKEAV